MLRRKDQLRTRSPQAAETRTSVFNGLPYDAHVHGPSFVEDLAMVLGVAGLTGLLSHRLKQPSVLGYLFAGLLVGPYLSVPLFADPQRVEALSEFGVLLVMFAVGLEFRVERFLRVLPSAGLTALFQISGLFSAGYALGLWFGWRDLQALFLGACICVSSTMAVTKILVRSPVTPPTRELVFGVLVLQDVAAVVLIAVMTALARGMEASFVEILSILGRLVLVLAVFFAVGMFIIPRLVRGLSATQSKETLVVGSVGICFATAVLAERLGYSKALGAFIGGVLVAESGQGHQVERASQAVRDVFAAVFFVSVGMTVDPLLALKFLPQALAVLATVVFAQLFTVFLGGIVSGSGFQRSLTAGLGLGQIGEFAFILASIGTSRNLLPSSIKPILVVVAMLSVFTSTQLLRYRESIVRGVGAVFPRNFLTYLSIYESWLDKLRTRPDKRPTHRLLPLLFIDFFLLFVLIAAWRTWETELGSYLARSFHLRADTERLLSTAALVVALVIPLIPLALQVRRVAAQLADRVFDNKRHPGHDLFRAVLVLLAAVAVGLPLALLLGPLLGVSYVWPALLVALIVPGIFAWKRATRWDHELTSGGQLMLQTIFDQGLPEDQAERLTHVTGLGDVCKVSLDPSCHAVGKTLTQLQLRSLTGASVIGVSTGQTAFSSPTGDYVLKAGDTLLLAGTAFDQHQAQQLLLDGYTALLEAPTSSRD